MSILRSLFRTSKTRICKCSLGRMKYSQPCWVTSSLEPILCPTANLLWVMICLEVTGCLCWSTFIHSGDLYSASSRDYYSEALTAQSRTKTSERCKIWKGGPSEMTAAQREDHSMLTQPKDMVIIRMNAARGLDFKRGVPLLFGLCLQITNFITGTDLLGLNSLPLSPWTTPTLTATQSMDVKNVDPKNKKVEG